MSEAHHSPSPPRKMHDDDGHGKPHKPMLHRYRPSHHHPGRLALFVLLLLLLLAGVTALVVYLVYRPSRPRFSVTSAAIYSLSNATTVAPVAAISSAMQFTLLIRNPNDRSSISYERLATYATYRGQAITLPAPLPPLFQERDSEVSVSPLLGGSPVPVSGDVAAGLATDQAYGVVALRLVVLGRLRFKSGPFHSGWHSMYVRCDVLAGLKTGVPGQVPLLGTPVCDVDI
ncbi:unnamed protein product [Musa acuminata subsp. burmannicoides]